MPKSRNRGALAGKGEWQVTGDPTEAALLIAAAKAGMTKEALSGSCHVLGEYPFDSETRFMAVLCSCGSEKRMYFKGAEEVILPRCCQYITENGASVPITPTVRRSLAEKSAEMSDRALRVLALAMCTSDALEPDRGNLVFLGFAGMTDPPREEAKTAIRKCGAASVKTVMITMN